MKHPADEVKKIIRKLRKRGLEEKAKEFILEYLHICNKAADLEGASQYIPYRNSEQCLFLKGKIRELMFNGYRGLI